MDNPSAPVLMDPRRIYSQIPSALATPPQSPSDDSWPPNQAAVMPLVTDLLARNGQMNVPPGFVLCIPCYLCKQPFNDIETFKEHLTQHAAEIHAWHTAQEQASQKPPMQPPSQPMYPPFLPWQQPPSMVSIPGHGPGPGPIHPPLSHPAMPPMQFPMQLHPQIQPVQPPLELPGHCPVHQPQPMEYPVHQRLHRTVPRIPQTPMEMMEQRFGYQKMQRIPPFHHLPLELYHEPQIMVQQPPAPPPVELHHKPQFEEQQPPAPPPVELHHKPQFMEQLPPAPPPVELQRIVLRKPIEPMDRHVPKEQPPKLQEEDPFSIERRLNIPPSMELQRIVLQKPQPPPVQSPIEPKDGNCPAEKSQSPSPEEEPQLTIQVRATISPEKELSPKASKAPYDRMSGRFQCEWCGKRLSSRQSVRYHQSRFHFMEDPPTYKVSKKTQKHFKCTTCKKRYKRRTFLLMHMKIKHGIFGSEAADTTVPPAIVESPVEEEAPLSPERPSSQSSSEGTRREVWSTKLFNAVAAAGYSPATEPAAKYVNQPRQQSELESEYVVKPKRVYPMRSPFFNPDLWLDHDAYF
ncbi:hypothetical protein KR032_001499 [Drosophila birchii]|nr:hypothetical protein KR032_001499 [Drosophila birchii]